jgi:hypothetical protein
VRTSFIRETLDAVESSQGKVRFVRLTCALAELERRLPAASRAEFGKLRSLALFRELDQTGAFEYLELADSGLSIDTGRMSPTDAAARICEFFSFERKAHL